MVLPFINSADVVGFTRDCYKDIDGVDIVGVDEGRGPLISLHDIQMNVPGILNRLVKAEKEGYKAAIVGCYGDPGLLVARQAVSIPVVGPGETSLIVASTLGERSMIVSVCRDHAYSTEKMVQGYGQRDRVVSIRWMHMIGVEACTTRSEAGVRDTAEICLKDIKEKDVHVVLFGCIGLNWMAKDLSRIIKEHGYDCPIVEPGITAMAYAKMLLGLGLNQSREMYKV